MTNCLCFGQWIDANEDDHIPYRPKIIEFSYNSILDYHTSSSSEKFGNSSSEIEHDGKLKARIGIPLVMRSDKLFGIQLKCDRQNFLVDFDNPGNESVLFNHIERFTFTALGARFLYQTTSGKNTWTVIAGSELRGDKLQLDKGTMKHYGNVSLKRSLNPHTTLGGGLAVAYVLGRTQIYPLFYYEKQLDPRWALDVMLPKSARVRYKATDKTYLIGSSVLRGWRYAVNNDYLSDATLTLQKADIQIGLGVEREIHDWLWFNIDIGLSKNLRYHLTGVAEPRRNALIDLNANGAPYANVGIFIVPPKSIYRRLNK